jgi:hypothetical protein
MEPISSTWTIQRVSLEEIEAEERLALAEQAGADRLLALASEIAERSRTRLMAATLARTTFEGHRQPAIIRHE